MKRNYIKPQIALHEITPNRVVMTSIPVGSGWTDEQDSPEWHDAFSDWGQTQ